MELTGLDHKEKVMKVINDHWIVFMRPFFLYISGWILIIGFYFLSFPLSPIPHSIVLFLDLLILWTIHHWLFIELFHQELSSLVVTDKRIIEFRFLPFLRKDITFLDIKKIKEIENHQKGLLKNILDYGDLTISLEGNERIVFTNIPKPSHALNLIEAMSKKDPNLNS